MDVSLNTREVLIGVTGGIAAYKTAELIRLFKKAQAEVSVVMTEAATQLISPRTFEALSGRPVRVSLWHSPEAHPHIDLSRKAEILCIAPATANILGKTACGIADDLLSSIYLAFDGPVFMAPAMNSQMWSKPSVQRNVQQLLDDGVVMIGPDQGGLSCGENGPGRMSSPAEIFQRIVQYWGLNTND